MRVGLMLKSCRYKYNQRAGGVPPASGFVAPDIITNIAMGTIYIH